MVVANARVGLENDAPAGLAEAVAEVNVVEVEGEALIEQADLVESSAPEGERGGHGLIDLAARVVVPVSHAVAAEDPAPGEEAGEAQGVTEDGTGLGEAAAGTLNGPVGEDELGGRRSHPRFLCEHIHERAERAGLDLRVGVEEEEEGGSRGADGLVVPGGEAAVLLVGDEADGGEVGAEHLDGAVGGCVVNDDDVGRFGAADNRAETRTKEVARTPGHDADVELWRGRLRH